MNGRNCVGRGFCGMWFPGLQRAPYTRNGGEQDLDVNPQVFKALNIYTDQSACKARRLLSGLNAEKCNNI